MIRARMIRRLKLKRGFASDNNAGIHPDILKALHAVNSGHVVAYGDDPYTTTAIERFHELFGPEIDVYFVFGGTGANVLGLKAVTRPFQSIICAETAHINVDECGAPEAHTGCKLLPVATNFGKLTVQDVKDQLKDIGDQHHVQPRVVSISQTTELGSIYTPREIAGLADFVHANNMLLHMDGARIANAAASLNVSFKTFTTDAGVDVLSFGGTKNGMLYGEAVVFFGRCPAPDFKFIRKQGMQLPSKMRFISAQFLALLSNDLWKKNAQHANAMARRLEHKLQKFPRIKTRTVEANAVFARLPGQWIAPLMKEYFFYVWDEKKSEVRLMTSFDTTPADVDAFIAALERIVRSSR